MVNEWIYLLLAALINTGIQFTWKKIKQNKIVDRNALVLIFLGSFGAAWAIDVIQKGLETMTLVHILKVSLGAWIMFAAGTAVKHYQINGWSLKQFKDDYLGDLIGFLAMGMIIHVLS